MKKGLLAVLVSVALVAMAVAATGTSTQVANAETVGGFAVKLAAAMGTPVSSQEMAVATLRSAGVNFDTNVSARLTEGNAARILADLGVSVAAPSNPAGDISLGKASQIAASAGLSLSAGPGITTDFPLQCLLEKNHGQCVGCCKDALGFDPEAPKAGQVSRNCSRFCKSTQPPPPSDPEPEP